MNYHKVNGRPTLLTPEARCQLVALLLVNHSWHPDQIGEAVQTARMIEEAVLSDLRHPPTAKGEPAKPLPPLEDF
jgi:hypothetical protein